jgi:hypothetical protein
MALFLSWPPLSSLPFARATSTSPALSKLYVPSVFVCSLCLSVSLYLCECVRVCLSVCLSLTVSCSYSFLHSYSFLLSYSCSLTLILFLPLPLSVSLSLSLFLWCCQLQRCLDVPYGSICAHGLPQQCRLGGIYLLELSVRVIKHCAPLRLLPLLYLTAC